MTEGQDYVYHSAHQFPTGAIVRWNANIEALRLVNELERGNRQATPAEQEVLAQYNGFGDSDFNRAFHQYHNPDDPWKQRRADLKELVTEDEFNAIEESRLNAFYTTPAVVGAMWEGLEDMGLRQLQSPKVLEPSAGAGRFLGMQPAALAERSERTAVELEPKTAAVLKHLYPESRVINAGFEDAPLPDDHFDVAISNVPFGDYPVHDRDYTAQGKKYLAGSIHNYFFAKTLDKLRPGGVMAFITSHNTMDSQRSQPVREYLASQADLVGAIRLPEGTFPDTKVVTDIMYLRKRMPGEVPGDDSWVETEEIDVPSSYGQTVKVSVNRYYLHNPEMALGKHTATGRMYANNSYNLEPTTDKPVTALPELVEEIAKAGPRIRQREGGMQVTVSNVAAPPSVPKYVVEDGRLQKAVGDDRLAHDLSDKEAARVKDLVEIRDTARRLVDMETASDVEDEEVEAIRTTLRNNYDAYVAEHERSLNTPENRREMGPDADANLLFALETYDDQSECWQPADILEKRIIRAAPTRTVQNAADALAVSLNEKGNLDFDFMGEMLGKSGAEVREQLASERLVYRNPATGDWETGDRYLTGDVREKLRSASLAAATDGRYVDNVKALEEVQPPTIPAEHIGITLGSPWIPDEVVNQWIRETLRPSYNRNATGKWFRYSEDIGEWSKADKLDASDAVLKAQWGTPEMNAGKVLEHTLEGSPINVTKPNPDGDGRVADPEGTMAAREKSAQMIAHYNEWLWQDPERKAMLVERYNNIHNAIRPRVFDGSHLTFPGMAAKWQRQIRRLQKDAAYRVVQDGTALLAHEVGFGKTATMVASAMERKRLGFINKPVFVLPKATHAQFVGQFQELYPGAKLLVPGPEDFQQKNRPQFLSRIATGDWDGVILTGEHFQNIPVSPPTQVKWLREQINDLRASAQELEVDTSAGSRRTHKQLQKLVKTKRAELQEQLDKLEEKADKGAQYFETLGIDQLYVDEADRYKNLRVLTNLGEMKGINTGESQRAWDMYMKVQYLQEKGQKAPAGSFAKTGVVFATGTPVANSIAETWTMMRYLQLPELKKRGLHHFDAWRMTYGDVTNALEQRADGRFKTTLRFAKFKNLPELGNLFQNVADIRVASEVPEMRAVQPRLVDHEGSPKRITVVSPPSPALEDYMAEIVERVDNLGRVDPQEDNMLKISGDARKAALDIRMVDPSGKPNPEGKIPKVAENVAKIYEREKADKGTQLVFLDMGTPKATKHDDESNQGDNKQEELTGDEERLITDVYNVLRREITARGVPEEEVAFIHDYKTNPQREALFQAVRDGTIRILIGSTETLGVGVNVQDRAAALHHVDIPWRPRDVEQREGRIVRQGNKVYGPVRDEEGNTIAPGRGVQIYQYVQQDSFDSFMWQAIELKATAIKSLIRREHAAREMEDVDALVMGAAEAKALASGNPLLRRKVELGNKVNTLEMSRRSHQRQVEDARQQSAYMETTAKGLRARLPGGEKDAAYVASLPEDQEFTAIIGGKRYEKRTEAGEALEGALKGIKYDSGPEPPIQPTGVYKGFAVGALNTDQGYRLVLVHPDTQLPHYSHPIEKSDIKASGLVSRLDYLVKRIPENAKRTRDKLAEAEDGLQLYKQQMDTPFAQAVELAQARERLDMVEARLASDSKEDFDWDEAPAAAAIIAKPPQPTEPSYYAVGEYNITPKLSGEYAVAQEGEEVATAESVEEARDTAEELHEGEQQALQALPVGPSQWLATVRPDLVTDAEVETEADWCTVACHSITSLPVTALPETTDEVTEYEPENGEAAKPSPMPPESRQEAPESVRAEARFRTELAVSRAEQERLDKKTGTKGINEVRRLVREVQEAGATDIPGMLQHYIDWFGEGGYQGRGLSVRQRDLEEARRLHAEVMGRQPTPPESHETAESVQEAQAAPEEEAPPAAPVETEIAPAPEPPGTPDMSWGQRNSIQGIARRLSIGPQGDTSKQERARVEAAVKEVLGEERTISRTSGLSSDEADRIIAELTARWRGEKTQPATAVEPAPAPSPKLSEAQEQVVTVTVLDTPPKTPRSTVQRRTPQQRQPQPAPSPKKKAGKATPDRESQKTTVAVKVRAASEPHYAVGSDGKFMGVKVPSGFEPTQAWFRAIAKDKRKPPTPKPKTKAKDDKSKRYPSGRREKR